MLKSLAVCLMLFHSAQAAAQLAPMQTVIHYIDSETTAYVLFSRLPTGLLVRTTLELGIETGPLLIRINSILLPGQSTEIVVPQEMGRPAAMLRIVRDGDAIRIEPAPSLASLQ